MRVKSVLTVLLVLCILIIGSSRTDTALGDDHAMNSAVEKLRGLGFDVDEQIIQEIEKQTAAFMSEINSNPNIPDEFRQMYQSMYESDNQMMFDTLLYMGMGDFNQETGEWTPGSGQVYAFDAEGSEIEHMYTLFLRGVQSIVPDVAISDIQEDLSRLTDEMIPSETVAWMHTDGKRTVSFLCNGHPYSIELESWGDWINISILDFMNEVLEKEGCPDRLHIVSDEMDQLVIMIYSTQERADMIKSLINVH